VIKVGDFMYRYEDVRLNIPICENDNTPYTDKKYKIHIRLLRMRVTKIQTKSVTVSYYGASKRILMTAKNPWAHPTPGEALISYKIRKNNQSSLLCSQLSEVKEILSKINASNLNNIEEVEV
jgi:hypothetical protein